MQTLTVFDDELEPKLGRPVLYRHRYRLIEQGAQIEIIARLPKQTHTQKARLMERMRHQARALLEVTRG